MNRYRTQRPQLLVAFLLVSVLTFRPSHGQEDFSDELPRIPPTEPADAWKSFSVADGFRMEQVAAEPLVASPVAIEWDALGRMYVCEMRGYSEDRDDGLSRIRRLEDTDGDGIYDTSVVYADGLLWPTAIFPYDGGLLVGDAPDIYYFKDTDGDGKADSKQKVLTGFAVSNVQGLLNCFRWGLDNRIHLACSSVGGSVRRVQDDPASAINVRGRDIAIDPRTFQFTPTSGAAQHGMCFDDWGRKFVSSNSNHIQQVMYEDHYIGRNRWLAAPSARVSIAADGPQAEVFRTSPVEPWRIVRTRLRVSGQVPGPIEGGGRAAGYFTGATGLTIYRGDAWPSEWLGLAVVGDVGSNLIHRKRLEPNGLPFIARRIDQQSEFVTSTDIWFRPAQFANAPDGSLHVIDVCREVIEHPRSLPPDIKRHLDLTSGRDRGRIYRIVPEDFEHRPAPRMAEYPTAKLVDALAHPNAWHRETAARLLFERQDKTAVDSLSKLAAESSSPLGRMHALYALHGLDALSEQILLKGLSDEHEQVRRHAVRLSERLPSSTAIGQGLVALADDPSLEVRYQLAFTIGSVECDDRIELLAALIGGESDDLWMQTAVQSSLADGAGQLLATLLADSRFRSASAGRFLGNLAAQVGQQNDREEIELALAALPKLPASDAPLALPVIGQLLKTRGRSGSVLHTLAAAGDLKPIDQLANQMVRSSVKLAASETAGTSARLAAIGALVYGAFDDVQPTLVALIDNRQPHQIQQAAITTLGRFRSDGVAGPLLEAWQSLSPQLRETASEVLFARPERTLALFDAIDRDVISPSDLAKTRWQVAARSKDGKIKARALQYLASSGSKRREEVVKAYADALTLSGDIERGRAQFTKHCSVCHKVEGAGHEIGPNLATIKTRGPETILVNVLDPNREVNPEYLNYVVVTVDGRSMTGMIASESATSITLRRAESAIDTVLRVDIDQLQSTGLSIMPEGLEEKIEPQAMADIIAYLMQVK